MDRRGQPDHLDRPVPLPAPPRPAAAGDGERAMKSKKGFYILGVVLLLGFAGFSASAFKETLTPYVPYETARRGDRVVQVAGALEKGSSSYAAAQESLYFTLKDPKTSENLRVR